MTTGRAGVARAAAVVASARVVAVAIVAGVALTAPARAVPGFEQVKAAHRPSDLTLLDRHGEPLQTLRLDAQVRRLPWVPIERMSPALLQALVMSEDRRFWQHAGIDWAAVARSAWGNVIDRRTRGASTLTMQLAGLIDDGLARPPGGRDVWRKLGQAVVAAQLEAAWSKSQILEAYLNSVPFRGEVVGVGALAHALFGKHPSGLDVHEAAVAAALVRSPNAPPARVAERACGVMQAMGGRCDGVAALADRALARRAGRPPVEPLAPHFARLALRSGQGAEQRSTLDARVQRIALGALERQLAELQGRQVEDGAVLVLDNASGEVRAWVGASGRSGAAQVDGVLAARQAGSTLKPFLYALAFEQRLITAASLLDDAPTELATANGLYVPQNYDRRFKGRVSARTALASSLNLPAVRLGAMLAPDALHRRLVTLGFRLDQTGGWYGASLALGSADVTLLSLTNAYRTLANGGLHAPVALPHAPTPRPQRAADAAASWLVADILADANARAPTFGLENSLRTRSWAAVKTGTSKDMRDNWCVGFTDRYTIGVWMGNARGEPMHEVSGVSGAAPVWREVADALHAGAPSKPPAPPPGLERHALRYAGDIEAARDEWFLRGSAPPSAAGAPGVVTAVAPQRRVGISAPLDGAVYALDPDIPLAAQRIRFEGEPGRWVLGGRTLGRGRTLDWLPRPGRHELVLMDARDRPVQRVNFDVRGLVRR